MITWSASGWLLVGALVLVTLIFLRRPLLRLCKLFVRSAVALGFLAVLGRVGPLAGITLGVNWLNAFLLGILGIPGFGLLLMMHWLLAV